MSSIERWFQYFTVVPEAVLLYWLIKLQNNLLSKGSITVYTPYDWSQGKAALFLENSDVFQDEVKENITIGGQTKLTAFPAGYICWYVSGKKGLIKKNPLYIGIYYVLFCTDQPQVYKPDKNQNCNKNCNTV